MQIRSSVFKLLVILLTDRQTNRPTNTNKNKPYGKSKMEMCKCFFRDYQNSKWPPEISFIFYVGLKNFFLWREMTLAFTPLQNNMTYLVLFPQTYPRTASFGTMKICPMSGPVNSKSLICQFSQQSVRTFGYLEGIF